MTAGPNVIRADGVPEGEFRVEGSQVFWRHALYDHRFEALWLNGEWALSTLVTKGGAKVVVPSTVPSIVRDYTTLLESLQEHGLEPCLP